MIRIATTLTLLLALTGLAQPTTAPAGGVDELLSGLHKAGTDLANLSANVNLMEIDLDTGDAPERVGNIALRRDADQTTFRVAFTGVKTNANGPDGKPLYRPEMIVYLLRGDELIDRNYATKSEVVRKLPPEQAGRDVLALGEGPFPLPIGQSPESVRRDFEVSEVDPSVPEQNELAEEAVEGTRRLRLVPREGSPLSKDFTFVEIDVDPATGLPAKVISLNKAGNEAKVTRLDNLKVNADLPAEAFELEKIDMAGWNVRHEDMTRRD